MMELRRDLLPWAHYVPKRLLEPPLPGQPDTRPYCIWTEDEAAFYYSLPVEQQQGWQIYVQHEVDAFNERGSYDRQAHLYHKWTPELTIREWVKRR